MKTAFLHGELREETFVSRQEGFKVKESASKVYKLHKALYGLKQVLSAWNIKLNRVLKELDLTRCSKEHPLFHR